MSSSNTKSVAFSGSWYNREMTELGALAGVPTTSSLRSELQIDSESQGQWSRNAPDGEFVF